VQDTTFIFFRTFKKILHNTIPPLKHNGNYTYHFIWIKKVLNFVHTLFVCFILLSQQADIISPNSANTLVFIMETKCFRVLNGIFIYYLLCFLVSSCFKTYAFCFHKLLHHASHLALPIFIIAIKHLALKTANL
jgi:hypothetical protein